MEDSLNMFKSYFDQLSDQVKSIAIGGKIFFMPNPGNWGDGLINFATYEFFKYYNIEYELLAPKKRRYYYLLKKFSRIGAKDILIYGGGGGWNKLWNFPLFKLQEHGVMNMFEKIIVFPSTYEIYIDDPKIVYFCRDKYQSKENNPSAQFCPDMAFFLAGKDLSKYCSNEIEEGFFYRTDKESAGELDIPPHNVDLSLKGDYLDHYDSFFKFIGKYKTLHTDRLHVCIAGLLLKKEVYFHRGSYFKNEAVYNSVMKNFENIHFE